MVTIDKALVKKLIETQFPQWKKLSITAVSTSGWDNRTFHLGDKMLVRLPSDAKYEAQVEKEHDWLPILAPFLPLKIPKPYAMGQPDENYPWKWSIYQWIEGQSVASKGIVDDCQFAESLAHFLKAFQSIDPTHGPLPGPSNFYRGGSLKIYDPEVQAALAQLQNKFDTTILKKIWEKALNSTWKDNPVWVHGDISAGNLLVQNDKLCAVIDFGQLAIGDPACDLAINWTLFKGISRETFRNHLVLDEDTWFRGMGWTLWKALITAAGMSDPSNAESKQCERITMDLIQEFKNGG